MRIRVVVSGDIKQPLRILFFECSIVLCVFLEEIGRLISPDDGRIEEDREETKLQNRRQIST